MARCDAISITNDQGPGPRSSGHPGTDPPGEHPAPPPLTASLPYLPSRPRSYDRTFDHGLGDKYAGVETSFSKDLLLCEAKGVNSDAAAQTPKAEADVAKNWVTVTAPKFEMTKDSYAKYVYVKLDDGRILGVSATQWDEDLEAKEGNGFPKWVRNLGVYGRFFVPLGYNGAITPYATDNKSGVYKGAAVQWASSADYQKQAAE